MYIFIHVYILIQLDGKRTRLNGTELKIINRLFTKHPSRLHFACADNHQSKDALMRSLIDLLGEPSVVFQCAAVCCSAL